MKIRINRLSLVGPGRASYTIVDIPASKRVRKERGQRGRRARADRDAVERTAFERLVRAADREAGKQGQRVVLAPGKSDATALKVFDFCRHLTPESKSKCLRGLALASVDADREGCTLTFAFSDGRPANAKRLATLRRWYTAIRSQ